MAITTNQPQKQLLALKLGVFGTESFTATPAASSNISKPPVGGNNVHLFGDSKKIEGKLAPPPAEWAGFLLIW